MTFDEQVQNYLDRVEGAEEYEIKEDLYWRSSDKFWIELFDDLIGLDGYDEPGSVITLAKTLNIVLRRLRKLERGEAAFKTIADCVWGEQDDLDTELFLDGKPVALLYMDNDEFAVHPRVYDVPADPEAADIFPAKSGAYYDRESEIIRGTGNHYDFIKALTVELVFVNDGDWVATTRKEAGL